VVHIEHGIGQFRGLVKMAMDNVMRSTCSGIRPGRPLYVPGAIRLTGSRVTWAQATRLPRCIAWQPMGASQRRARKAVAEIAGDLLELYAARRGGQGPRIQPDAAWQHELEASFPMSKPRQLSPSRRSSKTWNSRGPWIA